MSGLDYVVSTRQRVRAAQHQWTLPTFFHR